MPEPTTIAPPPFRTAHACWLQPAAYAHLGSRHVALLEPAAPSAEADPVRETVRSEVAREVDRHGGSMAGDASAGTTLLLATQDALESLDAGGLPAGLLATVAATPRLSPAGFRMLHSDGVTALVAGSATALLHGWHALARRGPAVHAEGVDDVQEPVNAIRMLDHWDNATASGPMGQVERGYAGGSLFFADGEVRDDLTRVEDYARLLSSVGITAVALNNVNVHRVEATLLTDRLPGLARLAAAFRRFGVRLWLSVDFAAPITLGGLPTSDPLDADVRAWWAATTRAVYEAVPDFGGYLVKADSEHRPGPHAYGRDHADGANLLARALAPFGGTVFWRAFVYNCTQDWRDRSTDRARAAWDHFTPLDGTFDDNVVLQVKNGPMDFQVREPVSPLLAAMPQTALAVEFQVTQEYTGQQKHVCYLVPQWSEVLGFAPWGEGGDTVAEVAARRVGGIVAVSNVGDDPFWTGHPLAQANLYGFARLAWDPQLGAEEILAEWVRLTFGDADPAVTDVVARIQRDSWRTYEDYTVPLGVGWMVNPGHHYGPNVDGYEYSRWGTYHFADRDGVGVDRTRATGTGYAGQYPEPWASTFESLDTCPDELLLFFHHVPYGHVLHSGTTVIQHIYDTHFAGVERVEEMVRGWASLAGRVDEAVHTRVAERLDEQLRSAREWRDQINTYFFRKSGVPDARGRAIY
jgi:alpha-glucuronidase